MSLWAGWLAGAAWADNYPLRHNCREPNEPWGKPDRGDVEDYHDDADKYERCLRDFALDQQEQAESHRDAARDAEDELDDFTRVEFDLGDEEGSPFGRRRW